MRKSEILYFDHESETSLSIPRDETVSLNFIVKRFRYEIVGFSMALVVGDTIIDIAISPEELYFLKALLGSIDEIYCNAPRRLFKIQCNNQHLRLN